MDALCCASPRKAGGVPTGPLGSAVTKLGDGKKGKGEDGEEMSFGDRAISLFGGKPKKKKEAKPKDDEDARLAVQRALLQAAAQQRRWELEAQRPAARQAARWPAARSPAAAWPAAGWPAAGWPAAR